MMTVSAAVRLIPSPPALVHRRNTNLSMSGRERGRGRRECMAKRGMGRELIGGQGKRGRKEDREC